MEATKLKAILEKHLKWLRGEMGGERANLSYSDLRGSNLSGSDLSGSNLPCQVLQIGPLRPSNLYLVALKTELKSVEYRCGCWTGTKATADMYIAKKYPGPEGDDYRWALAKLDAQMTRYADIKRIVSRPKPEPKKG